MPKNRNGILALAIPNLFFGLAILIWAGWPNPYTSVLMVLVCIVVFGVMLNFISKHTDWKWPPD